MTSGARDFIPPYLHTRGPHRDLAIHRVSPIDLIMKNRAKHERALEPVLPTRDPERTNFLLAVGVGFFAWFAALLLYYLWFVHAT